MTAHTHIDKLKLDTIYCMDCIEGMKKIEDNSIDLICTDPPYNIGKQFENDNLSDNDFFFFHSNYLFEIKRVIKNNHPIIICFSNGPNLKDYLSISGSILSFKRYITLYKPNDCSFPEESLLRKSEAGLLFTNNGAIHYESDINIHDCLIFNHKKKDKSFYHPSVKPIGFITKLIKGFTKENAVVLDPFMGSGTTAIACKMLNRHFIGFEINQEYVNIAYKRLTNIPSRKLEDYA